MTARTVSRETATALAAAIGRAVKRATPIGGEPSAAGAILLLAALRLAGDARVTEARAARLGSFQRPNVYGGSEHVNSLVTPCTDGSGFRQLVHGLNGKSSR